jgi:hypothetical protein
MGESPRGFRHYADVVAVRYPEDPISPSLRESDMGGQRTKEVVGEVIVEGVKVCPLP